MPYFRMLGVLFFCLSFVFGCQHTGENGRNNNGNEYGTANDYFPVQIGSSWTYKISPAPVETNIQTVTMVNRLPGNRFQDSKGNTFQLRTSGVHDGVRYLIKMPLAPGHRWMAVPTATVVERYELVAKNMTIAVPAGIFKSCLKIKGEVDIRESPGKPESRLMMEWIYAPKVGMIQLTQYVQEGKGNEPRRTAQYQLMKFSIVQQQPQAMP